MGRKCFAFYLNRAVGKFVVFPLRFYMSHKKTRVIRHLAETFSYIKLKHLSLPTLLFQNTGTDQISKIGKKIILPIDEKVLYSKFHDPRSKKNIKKIKKIKN